MIKTNDLNDFLCFSSKITSGLHAVLSKILFHIIFIIFATTFFNHSIFANVLNLKLTFWHETKKGTNIFNHAIDVEDIKAAKKYGIQFIRLAPDKFDSSQRDFLVGNADHYNGLVKEDLKELKRVLELCHQESMPVVITMLSLPGSRWLQNNKDLDDLRIWKNKKYQKQAAQFWQDLALELKDNPAVVGYNILNEPHPERIFATKEVHIDTINQEEVQKILHDFYTVVINSIRIVDTNTPIILDSSAYADPKTFALMQTYADQNILYSFHMYEPYEYTNHEMNKGKIYPGVIDLKQWDKSALKDYMSSVISFQKRYKIASNRILVGEFGGYRNIPGLEKYFADLIDIFHEEHWHFAFYAFREDVWDGMDYELGTEKLPWSYWVDQANGIKPKLNRSDNHLAFAVIKDAFK